MIPNLNPNTQLAILLLARWATQETKPLTNREFFALNQWLGNSEKAAAALLEGTHDWEGCPLEPSRLQSLLTRSFGVFHALNKWTQAGIWVSTWADNNYPERLKSLRLRAPALLFGYGNPNPCAQQTLAILGSRNASTERLIETEEIGAACARANITVISGGAKGVDKTAMLGALEAGGTCLGILADSLLREAGNKQYREGIMAQRLCLMSEVYPEAGFDVRNAMARNRMIYAYADATLIMECEAEKGGTWHGVLEARREGRTIYVLEGTRAEEALLKHGAIRVNMAQALQPETLLTSLPTNPTLPLPTLPIQTALPF